FFGTFSDYSPALHSLPTRRSSDLLPVSTVSPSIRASPSTTSMVDGRASFTAMPHGFASKDWRATASPCGRCSTRPLVDRGAPSRSEEHTSELQSRENLVCRLLLEK